MCARMFNTHAGSQRTEMCGRSTEVRTCSCHGNKSLNHGFQFQTRERLCQQKPTLNINLSLEKHSEWYFGKTLGILLKPTLKSDKKSKVIWLSYQSYFSTSCARFWRSLDRLSAFKVYRGFKTAVLFCHAISASCLDTRKCRKLQHLFT